MEQSLFARVKSATQFVFALTALVTAITSLVKACDKRLEQASYEALSTSIQDVQKDQAALRAELLALRDGDGIPDKMDIDKSDIDFDLTSPAPSTSTCVTSAPTSHKPSFLSRPKTKTPKPMPSSSSSGTPWGVTIKSQPPPAWADIKVSADKL